MTLGEAIQTLRSEQQQFDTLSDTEKLTTLLDARDWTLHDEAERVMKTRLLQSGATPFQIGFLRSDDLVAAAEKMREAEGD